LILRELAALFSSSTADEKILVKFGWHMRTVMGKIDTLIRLIAAIVVQFTINAQ
jgi:hypothetical protein